MGRISLREYKHELSKEILSLGVVEKRKIKIKQMNTRTHTCDLASCNVGCV